MCVCVLLFYLAILNRKTEDFFWQVGGNNKNCEKINRKGKEHRHFMLFMFFRDKQNWGERKYKNMYLGQIFLG